VRVDAYRTPDERFENLPDFPWEPRYRDVDGLRMAHVEDGDGPPVVMFHGEPTWSFLWRKVLPPVRDAGYRVILPDLVGFGRSDKPTDVGWYSYDGHVEYASTLFEDLDLRDSTIVVHDWGGAIGLRIAIEQPERVGRMVLMDTGLFTGHQRMTDAWKMFRDFVERTEDIPISLLVRRACKTDPGDEIAAAYDAPFPEPRAKHGPRAFPLMLPTEPSAPGAEAGQRVLAALKEDTRPKLFLWADSDPIIPLKTGHRFAEVCSTEIDHVIPDASHFLQEDQGELIGRHIAEWLAQAT
jgi:haloalkane dehalogenase